MASPPKANSQAEKLGVKKGDLVSSINGLNAAKMDSFEVTDYLAKYQVRLGCPRQGERAGASWRIFPFFVLLFFFFFFLLLFFWR